MEQLFHRIVYVFYILGQSAHNPYTEQFDDGSIIVQYMPSIIFICISITGSAFVLIFQLYHAVDYGRTDSIVAMIYLFSFVLSDATIIVQSLIYHSDMLVVCRKFVELQVYAREKLAVTPNYQNFCCDYLRKAIVIVLCYLAMLGAKYCLRTNESDFILGQGYSVLRLFTVLAKLHALFYVHLLKNVMRCYVKDIHVIIVQKQSGIRMSRDDGFSRLAEQMRNIKLIYLDLYEISYGINRFFGWGLITLFLECFVDALYSLYWIFIHIQTDMNSNVIIFSKDETKIDFFFTQNALVITVYDFHFSIPRADMQFPECSCIHHHSHQRLSLLHGSGQYKANAFHYTSLLLWKFHFRKWNSSKTSRN